MNGFSTVTVTGNLTRDPEIRQTATGKAVTNFDVAVNYTKDKTIFVDVTCWERLAEVCHEHLQRGSGVLVSGVLDQEKWKSREGQERSKLIVVAQRVVFLGKPQSGAGRDGQSAPVKAEDVDQTPPVKVEDENQDDMPF